MKMKHETLNQGSLGFHFYSCIALKMYPLHSRVLKNPSLSHLKKKQHRLLASKEEKQTFLLPSKDARYLGGREEWILYKEILLPVPTVSESSWGMKGTRITVAR